MAQPPSTTVTSEGPVVSRRQFVHATATSAAAALAAPPALRAVANEVASTRHTIVAPVQQRQPLAAVPFLPLPLGSIQARGWVLKQLELQRDGLTGHAPEVLPSLDRASSAWLNPQLTSGEDWEKGPYYAKGLVALAYTLNDDSLKKKAAVWVEAILASQRDDGYYGPRNDDWWPRIVANYLLRDYAEATGDERVQPFLARYYAYQQKNLPGRPLKEWSKARAGDEIDTIFWLYNRTGDESLLPLTDLLYKQAYAWTDIFTNNQFLHDPNDFHPKHAVNVAQALKCPPVYWQRSQLAADRDAFQAGLEQLAKHHGTPFGINTGTEFVSGLSTVEGVELCAIAEKMLSAMTTMRILGQATIGDEIELVAYNALPAALTKPFRQHVYYTLANNVTARTGFVGYEIDYADGRTPAPRSGCPCCCYNLHMAWPKLVQNSWAATPNGGVAALVYLPSQVTARVAGDQLATLTCGTNYPFEDRISLTVHVDRRTKFPLHLRVPAWCEAPSIRVNGAAQLNLKVGSFVVVDRDWNNGDNLELRFPMRVTAIRGVMNTASLRRGPLVYALAMQEEWKVIDGGRQKGFESFEVTSGTPWNYAIGVDAANLAAAEVTERHLQANPFETGYASPVLKVKAKRVEAWRLRDDGLVPLEPPLSPVASSAQVATIELVPFGSQMLRVTSFPVLGTPASPAQAWRDDLASGTLDEWLIYRGGYLQDGQLKLVKGAKALVAAAHFHDLSFEAVVTVAGQGDAGVMFRVSEPSIGIDGYKGYYVGINPAARAIVLGKANNRWIELTRQPAAVATSTAHRLRVEARGPNIRVWLGDATTPVLQLRDDSFAEGSIGVRSYATQAAFAQMTAREIPPT
ncbi:MAG: glycoside hydrolase family 127 protein [Pirellulales bacterium]